MICCRSDSIVEVPYLQFSQHAVKRICLNDLFRDNYCNPCLQSSINYLNPSTALCMARTSNLQDFNRGTTCGSHTWSEGTICGSHTWSGVPYHRWHDRTLIIQMAVIRTPAISNECRNPKKPVYFVQN